MTNIRKGRSVKTGIHADAKAVALYLPANYQVTGEDDRYVYFEGTDNAGWTMDGYVLPRLGSGLIFAEEIIHRPTPGEEAALRGELDRRFTR